MIEVQVYGEPRQQNLQQLLMANTSEKDHHQVV